MAHTELTIRLAGIEDLAAVAEVFLAAREGAVPAMPPLVHSADEVRAYVASWDLDSDARHVWVAEDERGIWAFAELKGAWLDDLYVHPGVAGMGWGSALLDVVKAHRPDGFCLWVFETNEPARAFYRAQGLVELERTDGSGNEEGSPDMRMAWPGANPLRFLRGLIDEVDADLGELLGRRAALTRAVQDFKPSRERDPIREREIAETMALRAPDLGVDRLGRIMDAVITESLDASAG